MRRSYQLVASAVISMSLIASSTAAVAQTAPAAATQIDPWAALSVMSGGASAAAACGVAAAAVAAAQPVGGCVLPQTGVVAPVAETVPPGPPPPPAYVATGMPPVAILVAWAAVLAAMIYIATLNNHTHVVPNSPA